MELTLFISFLVISLLLVGLGLFVTEHSELAIVGFLFIFLLGGLTLNGNIEHKVGTSTNVTCNYEAGNLTSTEETSRDVYEPISWDGSFNRSAGFYLGVIGIVGIVGVLIGIRRNKGALD